MEAFEAESSNSWTVTSERSTAEAVSHALRLKGIEVHSVLPIYYSGEQRIFSHTDNLVNPITNTPDSVYRTYQTTRGTV